MFYKKSLQGQLTVYVCGFVVRGCRVLFIVRLDVEDGGDNEFGDGRFSCVHEDGGKERGIRIQCLYLRMVAFRGVVRETTMVELVILVKAAGTWWSNSEKRDSSMTCVG